MSINQFESISLFATKNVISSELNKEKDEATSGFTSPISVEQASSISEGSNSKVKQKATISLSSATATLFPSEEKNDITNDFTSSKISYIPITIIPSSQKRESQENNNETSMTYHHFLMNRLSCFIRK